MLVLENRESDLVVTGRRIDDAVVVVLAGSDTRGNEERLDGGAGLENVGCRAIAISRRQDLLAVIRVVGGLIDHGEHFAGRNVDHDDRTAGGTVIADGGLQLPVGEVLDAKIDR